MNDILNMEGLIATSVHEGVETITIRIGRRKDKLDYCRHCGVQNVAPNGTRLVTYTDMPIRGKPVALEWERQRFKCRETLCGKSSTDIHKGLHDDFLMTRRLYEWIGKRSLQMTFAAIARDTGLDERSVRRVFEHWSAIEIGKLQFATPKCLGIDEVHLLNSPRGVLTNITERALLDLLPNRSQETMAKRIARMPDRDTVATVAMDMWSPYRRVADSLLPKAKVVIDKWHVLKYADAGLEEIRKSFRAGLTAGQRRRLMRDRFLLLSRRYKLRPEQRLILETWTNQFPLLSDAYEAKEAFYAIYDCATRREAESAYDNWKGRICGPLAEKFPELRSAMTNWREPIFNYFDNRVTNAYTEAVNGLIKIANRNGRGYSFDVLRARMLLDRAAVKRQQPKEELFAEMAYFSKSAPRFSRVMASARPLPYGIDIATMTTLLEHESQIPISTVFAG